MTYKKVCLLCTICFSIAAGSTYALPCLKDSIVKEPVPKPVYKQLDSLDIPPSDLHGLNLSHIQRLLQQQTISPLALSLKRIHNSYIQTYIDKYTSTVGHRQHLSEMLAQSQYYFPIFERIFQELEIPEEIKYLAIVESSLDPNAVSRVGATGPWQFMYATAKGYGLQIDNYIDERKDPIAASYAAAEYLKEAYDMYQDWYLAIASYNCGRGNINRAIRKSGKRNPSFWDIRPFLPRETRNYVPSFIALYQVLSAPEKHHIQPDIGSTLWAETEIVQVERSVSFSAIAKAINISLEELQLLNPAYKKNILQGSKNHPARVILPKVKKAYYAGLYQVLQGNDKTQTPALLASHQKSAPVKKHQTKPNSYITYKVQEGDTLEKISQRFKKGNTVASLKALNRLEDEEVLITPGTTLKIRWD